MSTVKYFRIFRSRMTSEWVRARVVQEQAWLKRFSDLAKPEWRRYNTECLTHG
jgi:hypothetical protein